MAIHQHVINQGPGKSCGALFSLLFSIFPLTPQGQDLHSPIHRREHGVSLHSSLQRVQKDLQEPYSWRLFLLYLHCIYPSRSWSVA